MKKNLVKNALKLVLTASLGASALNALEFGSMGQVSTSMGGAGVALKQSAWGVYYNPALLAADRRSKVAYSFGAQFKEQNLLEALTINFNELSKIASTLDEKLLGKASVNGAIAGGAISYIPNGNGSPVTIDGALGNMLGDALGIGHDGTLDANGLKNFAQDLGCSNCNNQNDIEGIAKELQNQAKNDPNIGQNLQNKLVDAAEKNGAPPLLTQILKNTDPTNLTGLLSGALNGQPPSMEEILSSVGTITLPRGADSDIDRLIDSFNILNNTLHSNDLLLNSQNGIVLQIGGRPRTKKIETDGIGELSVQEIDSGRGAVAIAILPQVFAGASANIDPTHNRLIVHAGGKYIEANISEVGVSLSILTNGNNGGQPTAEQQFKNFSILSPDAKHEISATSLALIEVPVGYGHTFFSRAGDIHLGGAVKFIQAFAYRFNQTINFDNPQIATPEPSDIVSQQTFAIDLGLLYTPFFAKKLNLGLVAKNLNAPHINMNTGSIILNRQLRAGVSYELLDFLTIAADYDILPNNTLSIVNTQSQMLGGGILADFKYIDFRLGAMKDMKSKAGEGAILTGGVNMFGFLDIAFQYGLSKNVTLYGFNVSNYMALKVGGQFSW